MATTAKQREPDPKNLIRAGRDIVRKLEDAEQRELSANTSAKHARDAANARRLELGQLLVVAREQWPARGRNAKGWGEYLDAIGVKQQRAHELMALAGYVAEHGYVSEDGESPRVPSLVEAGIREPEKPFRLELVPHPDESDEPEREDSEPDRGSWCTPIAIARDIGKWDYDPCTNSRSHVQATTTFDLARGEDGITMAATVDDDARVFVNPDYADVMAWVRAYGRTRFCFLVRLDFSTQWFDELYKLSSCIYIPRRERVQFEPPPGVEASSNPFPHGLVYARFADVSAAVRNPENYLALRITR